MRLNCRGYKKNYHKLLLLITEPNPTAIFLPETLRYNDKQNTKTFEQYDYIYDIGQ